MLNNLASVLERLRKSSLKKNADSHESGFIGSASGMAHQRNTQQPLRRRQCLNDAVQGLAVSASVPSAACRPLILERQSFAY